MSEIVRTDWLRLEAELKELGVHVEKPSNQEGRLLCQLPDLISLTTFREILQKHAAHAVFEPSDGHIVYPISPVGSAREVRPRIQGTVSFPQRKRRRNL